jgi:hypothetical protein
MLKEFKNGDVRMNKTLAYLLVFFAVIAVGIAAGIVSDLRMGIGPNFFTPTNLSLGNGSTDAKIVFNDTETVVMEYVDNTNENPNHKTLQIRTGNATGWFYDGGYAPVLNVYSQQYKNYGVAAAFQVWAESRVDADELFGFWGGIHDSGDNAPNIGSAWGLQPYNTMWGTNPRTIDTIGGVYGTTECQQNMSGTNIIGLEGKPVATGNCSYTNAIGVHAVENADGRITNSYNFKGETLDIGTNKWTFYGGTNNASFGSNVYLRTNTARLILGTTKNMEIYYNGAAGIINTSTSGTAKDLYIQTGAGKTLVLNNSVYNDIQFPTASGKNVGGIAPTWESLTTNVNAYSFTSGDYLDLAAEELPHWWKEGTKGDAHVHLIIKTLQNSGANRYANFTAYVALSNVSGGIVREIPPLSAVLTIPNGAPALTPYYLDLGDIGLTGTPIGSQVRIRIKRTAQVTGTEYAYNIFASQIGIHLEKDTGGSRSELTK